MPGTPDFRILFESAPGLYLVLTPNLDIVAVSDAYLMATMTTREAILGQHLFNVFPDNPEDPNATGVGNLRASLNRVLQSRGVDVMAIQKYDVRRPSSGTFEERYWSPVNSPVFGPDGKLEYIIHRVEDVTEFVYLKQQRREQSEKTETFRRRAEQMEAEVYLRAQQLAEANEQLRGLQRDLAAANQELQQRNQELERANRLKSEFLASMSHELRTPLNAIVGFSDLLAEQSAGSLNTKQQRFNAHIQQGGRHLLALINDLLDLSKIEAGHLELHRVDFPVAIAAKEILATIGPAAAAKRIDLENGVGTQLVAHADRIRFKQILYNLVGNAIKFTPEGGKIRINASVHEQWLTVTVEDTGIGIAADKQHVFEMFLQLGTAKDGVKEGTGLGLAITKRLVQEHGGRIWVESEPGEGTRFRFTVPAALPSTQGLQISVS